MAVVAGAAKRKRQFERRIRQTIQLAAASVPFFFFLLYGNLVWRASVQETKFSPTLNIPKTDVNKRLRIKNTDKEPIKSKQARALSEKLVFDRENPFHVFAQWTGSVHPGMTVNHESLFLGVQTNCTFYTTFTRFCAKSPEEETRRKFPYPVRQDDHFFEWSDLIAALLNAHNSKRPYFFLELGAGWAKWIVDAEYLANQLSTPIKAIGVEAQPNHCKMADMHMAENLVTETRMICAAVGETDGTVEFPVDASNEAFQGKGKFGHGIQMLLDGKPWDNVVKIQAIGICSLVQLADWNGAPVDFVSLDVQSFEHSILNEDAVTCMDPLVRLVHISLHRVEANDARPLTERFLGHGWKLIRYFPLETPSVDTAVGPTKFADGRLTFINPRLTPTSMYNELYDHQNVHLGTYTAHKFKTKSPFPDWGPGDTIADLVEKFQG